MARFKIYSAKVEDISQGWIWLGGHDELDQRSIVRLSAVGTGKSVYCEVLKIDGPFITDYNCKDSGRIAITDPKSAFVANEWYRKRLGYKKNTEAEIDVKAANHFCGQVRACLNHPQVVVRLPVWLAILSVGLAVLAIILTLLPFFVKTSS